jgi:hypothetical protein
MWIRKFAVSLGVCWVALVLLTAVASAVPADAPVTPSPTAVGVAASPVRTVFSSLYGLVGNPAGIQGVLRTHVPSAEPMALVLFGAILIGAARIARRDSPEEA